MFDCKRYVVLVILFWHWHYYKLSHTYAVTAFNGIDFQYLLDDVSLCIKRNSSSKEFKSEVSDSGKKSKKKKAVEKKKMFSLFYNEGVSKASFAICSKCCTLCRIITQFSHKNIIFQK